ncbi:MAG: hypothetical protein U5L07_17990 [Desulfobacterales bacterium]|nr:hypothetical protein [Desulfobacterales bacterium]
MKFVSIVMFISFFGFVVPSYAVIEVEKRFIRFQGKTVSVEDPVGHLIDTFGEPYHKEKQTNWVRLRRNRVVERDVFLWFYRLGGEHGGETDYYKFIIYDGIIQKIVEID